MTTATRTTESAADRAPLVLALVENADDYPDLEAWASDSDYLETDEGWVNHADVVVDIAQCYLDAKESELAALEADAAKVAAGGSGFLMPGRIALLRLALTGTRAQILVHAYPPQEGISVGDGFYEEGDGADGFHEAATAAGFATLRRDPWPGNGAVHFTMRHRGDGSLVTYQEGDLFLTQHVHGVEAPLPEGDEVTDLHLPDGSCCDDEDDLITYEVTVEKVETITYRVRATGQFDAEARYAEGDEVGSDGPQPRVVSVVEVDG